jgi:hypothetical protein
MSKWIRNGYLALILIAVPFGLASPAQTDRGDRRADGGYVGDRAWTWGWLGLLGLLGLGGLLRGRHSRDRDQRPETGSRTAPR